MKMTSIFKKASIFASAIVLVLVMVMSVAPAVFAEEPAAEPTTGPSATGETLVASNITISGNIAMTYYYQGLKEFADTDYILITVPNQDNDPVTNKIYFSEINKTYDAEKDRWAVTVPVAYAQQTVDIKMQWFKGETAGKERVRTVKDYADSVLSLANAGDSTYVAVAPAVTNMLNAGAMAQVALGYNTGNLANAGLFDADNPIDGMLAEHFYGVEDKVAPVDPVDQITFIGADVLLQSKVNLRVYLTCPDNVTTATVSYGSETVTVKIKGNNTDGKYVGINNILASNFDKRFTVTVGENSYTYSVLDYAMDTLNAYFEDDTIGAAKKNTAKALYLFYASTKAYVTKDSETPFVAGPADCQHARTYVDGAKIVCSDCHKVVEGASIKLSVSSDTVKLVKGETANVTLTFALNGNVDLTGIIFTPKCDGLTLERVDANIDENYYGEFGKNAVVLGKEANDTLAAGTIATATYAITATETGTYKITVNVHQATVGTSDASGTVSVGYAAVEVVAPLCESDHTFTYTHAGAKHLARCTKCPYVEYADHTYVSTVTDADGVRTYNSSICSVCGIPSVNNIKSTYTIGFTVDAEGTKTEKAPLVVLTPADMANVGATKVNKVGVSADGSYYTFTNDTAATGEGYIHIFDSKNNDNPYGVTGQYLMIKYRTNYTSSPQIYIGANNGNTGAAGNGHFFLTTGQKSFVSNGQWQVVIFDLTKVLPDGWYKAETGDDAGKYKCDYIRFDLFNTATEEDAYYDIAYIAMSDDIMSLASFNGNDAYTVCENKVAVGSSKLNTALATYTGSVKTSETTCFHVDTAVEGCNTVCARCKTVMSTTHTAGTYYSVTADPQHEYADCAVCGAENVASRFANTTFKGLTIFTPNELNSFEANANYTKSLVTENGLTFFRATSKNGQEGTLMLNSSGSTPIEGVGKRYIAIMARKTGKDVGYIQTWVSLANNSGSSKAKSPSANLIPSNGGWTVLFFDYNNFIDDSVGLGWTRIDVLDGTKSAGDIVDIAWAGFFNDKTDAYEMFDQYMRAYVGCDHHDASKLENITDIEDENSLFTVTADCTVCGQKNVKVILETIEGLKVYTAGELIENYRISGSNTLSATSFKLVANDSSVNNMPYARFTYYGTPNSAGAYPEGYVMLNLGTSNLTGASNYMAILHRRTTVNGNNSTKDVFQVLHQPAGVSTSSGNATAQGASFAQSGEWVLDIINIQEKGKLTEDGLGWTRLDIFNSNHAHGKIVDIAYAAFFTTVEEAQAYYAEYIKEYLGQENCPHTFEKNIKQNENTLITYNFVCSACGYAESAHVNQNGLAVFDGSDITAVGSVVEGVSGYPGFGTLTTYTDPIYNNLEYTRLMPYRSLAKGEAFLFLKLPNPPTNVGKYVAIIYRSNSMTNSTMYISSTGDVSANQNGTMLNSWVSGGHAKGWNMCVYDFSARTNWGTSAAPKTLRLAFGATSTSQGKYLDIAYIGFFSSKAEADAFYTAFQGQYNASQPVYKTPYRTQLDSFNVNAVTTGGTGGWENGSPIFNLDKTPLETPKSIDFSGWFIADNGTKSYAYKVIGADGTVLKTVKLGTPSDKTDNTALAKIATDLGLTASGDDDCRKGSSYGATRLNLTDFLGQTVSVEMWATTNNGLEIKMFSIINIHVPEFYVVIQNIRNEQFQQGTNYNGSPIGESRFAVLDFAKVYSSYDSSAKVGTPLVLGEATSTVRPDDPSSGTIINNAVGDVNIFLYAWLGVKGVESTVAQDQVVYRVTDANGVVSEYKAVDPSVKQSETATVVSANTDQSKCTMKINCSVNLNDYKGQTVKVEIAVNRGTAEAPDYVTFMTYTNVAVPGTAAAAE